jgi:hypothetical protein
MNVGSTMPQAIDGCLYHIISQHGFDNTISGKKRPRPGVAAAKGGGSNCSAGAIGVADSFCKSKRGAQFIRYWNSRVVQ